MFVTRSYLLAGFPGEHMPLPAEILPQLLSGSALSGQPEAQRGLWNIREGTGEGGEITESGSIACMSQSCDKDVM